MFIFAPLLGFTCRNPQIQQKLNRNYFKELILAACRDKDNFGVFIPQHRIAIDKITKDLKSFSLKKFYGSHLLTNSKRIFHPNRDAVNLYHFGFVDYAETAAPFCGATATTRGRKRKRGDDSAVAAAPLLPPPQPPKRLLPPALRGTPGARYPMLSM